MSAAKDLVIHHMTLRLADFGKHDPECCCSLDQTPHAADCRDCECGLADAVNFGVSESGIPLEPEPMTPDEERRLQTIARRTIKNALAATKKATRTNAKRLGLRR